MVDQSKVVERKGSQDSHWAEYGEIILGKMRDGQRGLIVSYRFLETYALIEDWPGDWERPVEAWQKGHLAGKRLTSQIPKAPKTFANIVRGASRS
jgi:hypothetical protein